MMLTLMRKERMTFDFGFWMIDILGWIVRTDGNDMGCLWSFWAALLYYDFMIHGR